MTIIYLMAGRNVGCSWFHNGKKCMTGSHQMCVKMDTRCHEPLYDYQLQKGWYQGCYFVRRPEDSEDMLWSEFKILWNKIVDEAGFDTNGYKQFCSANGYASIYAQLQTCMNDIMARLLEATGQVWTYDEGSSGQPEIKRNLAAIDAAAMAAAKVV